MKQTQNITKTICEIGIFAAIGYVLDEFQSVLLKGVFINGGSIGFAMIAVLIIGFRRGFWSAFLTGIIIGLLDLATGAYIIHPAQLLLDYLIPYSLVAFGVLLRPSFLKSDKNRCVILIFATTIGGIAKLLSHYLSGVLFWANPNNFAWGLSYLSPYTYSFLYNFAFIGPSIVITAGLLILLWKKAPKILAAETFNMKEEVYSQTTSSLHLGNILSILTMASGLTLFIYYLINYINSYAYYKSSTSVEFSFSQDCMVIFIIGIFIIVIGLFSLIKSIKKSFNIIAYFYSLIIVSIGSAIYSLTKLIKFIIKNKPYNDYIIWLIISLLLIIAFFVLQLFFKKKKIKII